MRKHLSVELRGGVGGRGLAAGERLGGGGGWENLCGFLLKHICSSTYTVLGVLRRKLARGSPTQTELCRDVPRAPERSVFSGWSGRQCWYTNFLLKPFYVKVAWMHVG